MRLMSVSFCELHLSPTRKTSCRGLIQKTQSVFGAKEKGKGIEVKVVSVVPYCYLLHTQNPPVTDSKFRVVETTIDTIGLVR